MELQANGDAAKDKRVGDAAAGAAARTEVSDAAAGQSAMDAARAREAVIVRTSVVGIVANVLLAAFKALVGFASNSIAVILDAVNNLSDALS